MNIQLKALSTVACACCLIVAGCTHDARPPRADDQSKTTSISEPAVTAVGIELAGSGLDRPIIFSYEQLSQMKMTRLDNLLMQRTHGPDAITSWQGPALDTLLTAAHVKPGPMTITLCAADGYTLACDRKDLESAIVALEDGRGRRLIDLDPTCRQRLIAPSQTGNYWVRNLCLIRVEPTATP